MASPVLCRSDASDDARPKTRVREVGPLPCYACDGESVRSPYLLNSYETSELISVVSLRSLLGLTTATKEYWMLSSFARRAKETSRSKRNFLGGDVLCVHWHPDMVSERIVRN